MAKVQLKVSYLLCNYIYTCMCCKVKETQDDGVSLIETRRQALKKERRSI